MYTELSEKESIGFNLKLAVTEEDGFLSYAYVYCVYYSIIVRDKYIKIVYEDFTKTVVHGASGIQIQVI